MNTILNKIGEIRLTPGRFFLRKATKALRDNFGFWIALFAIVISLTSCSDDLDVQQSYPFTVEVMPYGDKITKGETVELRFEIKPEGNYAKPSTQSATSSMTAKARSNLSMDQCWSTTTVCFSKARLSD